MASCKCKAGWAGNGNLCLPQKTITREDISGTESRDHVTAHLKQAVNVKKHSQGGAFAALNALTSKLNQLKKDQEKKLSVPKQQNTKWLQAGLGNGT